MLEELDVEKRLRMVAARLATQLDILELQSKIQKQVTENIDKSQRRFYLQEQLKAIRKELGEGGEKGAASEVDELRKKLEAANPPEPVMKEALRELSRLEGIPSASPEYGVIRTYLQILSELPWNLSTQDKIDVKEARKTLDRDHFDLDKVKRRILEYLAIRKLTSGRSERPTEGGGAILCFVGPPGVGKTSLGNRSRSRWAESSFASPSAACAMRPIFGGIGGLISVRCRGGSSRRFARRGRTIR